MSKPQPIVNPRGIPQAPFVEKVEDFIKTAEDVDPLLKQFNEMLQKYRFMESSKTTNLASVKQKIPDIKKTLEMVTFLDSRKDSDESIETNYELNDTLFARASITPSDTVYLWLGANVMLEYPISEAIELLEEKLKSAKESLKVTEEDLEFLKENITTMQVNINRLYNWDVQRRRDLKNKK